MIIISQELLNT